MTINPTHFEIHLTVTSGNGTPVDLLASETSLSKQRIKQAMQKGAVWLTEKSTTHRVRRAKRCLRPGDVLHLYYDEKVLSAIPAIPELISDEIAYSVWRKPYGMLSQGSKWGDHCAINRWVEQNLTPQRPAFVVHRLDRAATGLIIIAHQKRSAAALTQLFHDRQVSKHYRAIVNGQFPEHGEQVFERDIDGKKAFTSAHRLSFDESSNTSLLDVQISTGRKHQIRRHLAENSFPIVGDRLYGEKKQIQDLQLCACYLAFTCPVTGNAKEFTLPEALLPVFPVDSSGNNAENKVESNTGNNGTAV